MKRATWSVTSAKLEILLSRGTIQIERTRVPCEYEVTVFDRINHHSHHGGATLAEAIGRAYQATCMAADDRSDPRG